MPAVPVARHGELLMYVLQEWRVIGRWPGSNRVPPLLTPRWLTTELPALVAGWGGPSGVEHVTSQDDLR